MAGLLTIQRSSQALPARLRRFGSSIDPVARRVGLGQLAALVATALALLGDGPTKQLAPAIGLTVCIAMGALRTANVHRPLALSTLLLDAVGTALIVAGTGAPASAYIFLALAGAWWAAHIRRPHSGIAWAVTFVVGYGVLVVPAGVASGGVVGIMEDTAAVLIVGVLADWFVRVDTRAIALSETLAAAPAGAETLAIRDGVTRALGPMEVPVDVVLAASRAGLTVVQTELLAYLVLGLSNQEIADATTVSVATVRYRLTRLYRKLGVRGRRAAMTRATQLGLASSL